MKFQITFTDIALEDIEKHKKSGNKSILRKIVKLITELMHHPTTGTGQPELLKHDLSGLYSRRINRKHRLVYSIYNQKVTVLIVSAWSH